MFYSNKDSRPLCAPFVGSVIRVCQRSLLTCHASCQTVKMPLIGISRLCGSTSGLSSAETKID